MELDELKNMWSDYDKKLDKSLKLNIQLLRKINLDKAKNKLRKLMILKLMEMIILAGVIIFLVNFIYDNITSPQFSISAGIFAFFALIGFISNVKQVAIMMQLQGGYTEAIAPLQRKIEQLKLLIVKYVKYALLSIPFFPIWMILITKILFNYDIYTNSMSNWWLANICVSIALIPLVWWIFKQLSKNDISRFWVKNFLEGSGWKQAEAARAFLTEIDDFERDI
jgi:hypothetical protein